MDKVILSLVVLPGTDIIKVYGLLIKDYQEFFLKLNIKPKRMENKKLILSLIRADIINNKLLSGLSAIGLDGTDNYLTDLDDRVFELIGFDITNDNLRDQVFERYMKIVDKAAELDISELKQRGRLDAITENVYNELLKYKLELYTADEG